MASNNAIIGANTLAKHYVAGSDKVRGYRTMMPDYKGYVNTIAPLLDEAMKANNEVMAKRHTMGLPSW